MPKLENWSIGVIAHPYSAPETWVSSLHGNVYGHPKFQDGDEISTSQIEWADINKKEAKTANTLYFLGQVSEDWVGWLKKNGYTLEQYHKPEVVKS